MPIGISNRAFPVRLVISEFTSVCIAIRIGIGALPIEPLIFKHPLVYVAVGGNIDALTEFFAFFKAADVFVAARNQL